MNKIFEYWSPKVLSVLVFLAGFINLVSAANPALRDRFLIVSDIFPLTLIQGARVVSALLGFFLLILAMNLWRHKQAARVLAIIILSIAVVTNLIKGLDYEESLYMVSLVFLLLLAKPYFHARSDTPSVREGMVIFVIALVFTFVYCFLGLVVINRHFHIEYHFISILNETLRLFMGFQNPEIHPYLRSVKYFTNSVYVVGVSTIFYSLFKIFSPVAIRREMSERECEKAFEIVNEYGKSVLARFALFPDKTYFFSNGCLIAYAVSGRVAVCLGDPIGPKSGIANCIAAFQELCDKNDWESVYYQTREEFLPIYKKNNYSALAIGYEAILDLHNFTLDGRENKKMRSSVKQVADAGFKVKFYKPPIKTALIEDLRFINDQWLEGRRLAREEGFSLGWFDNDYIKGAILAVAYAKEGEPCAFLNLVPEYQKNEIAVDLMRFIKTDQSGVMDFLFTETFKWAKSEGYDTFNLGLSILSKVGEEKEDPAIEKMLKFVYNNLGQFYNFKGLYKFKEKFHPDWQCRYLIYKNSYQLPVIATAIVRVHL